MRSTFALLTLLASVSTAFGQTIYPVDRAEFLVGSRFDFKVELPSRMAQSDIRVTINGTEHAGIFGRAASFIETEDGKINLRCDLRVYEHTP